MLDAVLYLDVVLARSKHQRGASTAPGAVEGVQWAASLDDLLHNTTQEVVTTGGQKQGFYATVFRLRQ